MRALVRWGVLVPMERGVSWVREGVRERKRGEPLQYLFMKYPKQIRAKLGIKCTPDI